MRNDDELFGARTAPSDGPSLDGITSDEAGVLDAVDLPIVVLGSDCRVTSINRAATTALGLTNSDIGRPVGNTFAGGEDVQRLCTQVMADGAPCRRETREGNRCFLLRIAPKTGSNGQILGAVLTFTNVTAFRASMDQAIYEREYTKAILNTVSDPLVVLDANLRVQTANRAFYAMFGVSRDETQGVSIRKLGNHDWETSEVWNSIETTVSEQSDFQSVEIDREFPALGRRTVVLEARRLAREGDTLILVAFQDMTERKRTERLTGLLAAIVASSDDAIVSKNLDGVITSWNKGAERLFGYSAAEMIGQNIRRLVPPSHRDEEETILERLRRGERIDHFETVRVRKDGTIFDVSLTISPVKDAAGRVIGASKVARDITEHRRVERALAEQAGLLDLSFDAIFVRDAADRITYWNEGATELYGYSREEALGRVSHELLDTEFPESWERIMEQLQRESRWSGELTHKRKDGTSVVVASRWALDRGSRGSQHIVLESNSDITHQKQNERALRESEERLRTLANSLDVQVQLRTEELERRNSEFLQQAEQLRELSKRLLQSQDEERRRVARELHDGVGQLLAAINMNLSTLDKERYSFSFEARRCLGENTLLIEQAVQEIRTISHLLHPPMLDEIGLESALRWYVGGFAERSKIAVKMQLTPGFSKGLERDVALSLFRVVQECLINIHRHSGSKTAFVGINRSRDEIALDVKDDGKGISPELQAKIAMGAGSGVGLRGIRERIQQLGGRLDVESDGNGTRIGAVLPVGEWIAPEVRAIPDKTAAAH